MLEKLERNQNWAKACPWMAAAAAAALFIFFPLSSPMFWALVNIPLYLLHQTEEHYIPGGFKKYMNEQVLGDGKETLTDRKIFWINILLVWIAFLIFGALSFVNLGFGLVIVIFSIINCATHIAQAVKARRYNPGLVMASLQLLISLYAAYYITANGLGSPVIWWVGSVVFSAAAHAVVFRTVMSHGKAGRS